MIKRKILVTGSTGYVGGRLVPRLLSEGYKVKAVSRSIEKLKSRDWASHPNIELLEVDMFDFDSVKAALVDCEVVYYLVHSMNKSHRDFARADRLAAQNLVNAANESDLKSIIYLGGLGEEGDNLSKHLKSRAEVAQILKTGKIPVTVLRAAMIIGSGSASFEMMRYLVNRLPFMITPKWIHVLCQPISIRNVINYLIGCLENEGVKGKTFDIGGSEILTYKELMDIYAEEAGLGKRFILPIPVFTAKLSSYWIHLVTPIPSYIAWPLAEGLKNSVVCKNDEIKNYIQQDLLDCRKAIRLALNNLMSHNVESHWTDAGIIQHPEWVYSADPKWAGGTIYSDKRKIIISGKSDKLWKAIIKIGGLTGWYYGNWLWRLRGVLDKLFGGVGLRRGRRHPFELRPGDVLDFWRVINVEKSKSLLLVAEMKLPGTAILGFNVEEKDDNTTELTQVARFLPNGVLGILYWYLVTPLHALVFNGMMRGIAKAAKEKILDGPRLIKI